VLFQVSQAYIAVETMRDV